MSFNELDDINYTCVITEMEFSAADVTVPTETNCFSGVMLKLIVRTKTTVAMHKRSTRWTSYLADI